MTGIATIVSTMNCPPPKLNGMGIHASNVGLIPMNCYCYMPYGSGQGDIIWQGGEFGLVLANPTSAEVLVTHRVSDPAAFSSVTARLYVGSIPVGTPAQFRTSMTYVTDSVTAYTGINSGNLSALTVRVTWHQVAPGLAYVQHSYATTPAPVRASLPSGMNLTGIV